MGSERVKGHVRVEMREADKQKGKRLEEGERSKKQERKLCLAGTFKGCTCLIADSGVAPGDK